MNKHLKAFQKELTDILEWWMTHTLDHKNGGFIGRVDVRNQREEDADKMVILNTRILWTFAAAARTTKREDYHQIATRAFNYVCDYFLDQQHGGVHWLLDAKGTPINSKKQIYAQAFAIYGFVEYHLLTGDERALQEAIKIFDLVEKHSLDKEKGGYLEAFKQQWDVMEDLRLGISDANEPKTMNTHLHVLEAYTHLYRVQKTEKVRAALERLITYFLEKFIDSEEHHLHLFFDMDWNLKSHEVSYGHDIECSWLLWEAAEVLGDEALEKEAKPIAILMARAALANGLDKDGSMYHELETNGHMNKTKYWWPQAEAVVGFWNAWQLSGEKIFKKQALETWKFIQKHQKDSENGEWHWGLTPDNVPIYQHDKAGPWKAPYHNGRMCMEMIRRLAGQH